MCEHLFEEVYDGDTTQIVCSLCEFVCPCDNWTNDMTYCTLCGFDGEGGNHL